MILLTVLVLTPGPLEPVRGPGPVAVAQQGRRGVPGAGAVLHQPLDTVSTAVAFLLGTAGLPHILMRFFTVPARVVPRHPEQAVVGSSGDLAPLAHLALVLIGEGEAFPGAVTGARHGYA